MLFVVIILVIFEGVRVDDIYFLLGSLEERRFSGLPAFFLLVFLGGLLSFDILFLLELPDLD